MIWQPYPNHNTMKHLFLSFLIFTCLVTAEAQNNSINVNLSKPRPKVGVVLGGGGAKGASHIGVLKYIEEMGTRPTNSPH